MELNFLKDQNWGTGCDLSSRSEEDFEAVRAQLGSIFNCFDVECIVCWVTLTRCYVEVVI